jgi:AcrR family transcriptional regulator
MAVEKLDTEIRREQIAEAALNLVAGQGPRKLSIAAVARRVGLVPSGIYRHFKNKDEILDAVLDLIQSRLTANVEAATAESNDPLEQLHGALVRHIRFIREGRAIPQMIFSEELHGGRPQKKQRILKIIAGYREKLAEIIRAGQKRGCIRAEIDPSSAVLMLIGAVVPAAILWHLTDGGFDVTRHAQHVWPMFRRAVEPQGDRKRP